MKSCGVFGNMIMLGMNFVYILLLECGKFVLCFCGEGYCFDIFGSWFVII